MKYLKHNIEILEANTLKQNNMIQFQQNSYLKVF